ncbi:MAG TPA: RluA family pseudouridine synthase [Candidatus Deferrimicrobiaceae bacterium]
MLRDQIVQAAFRDAGLRLDRFLRDRFPGVPARSVRFALDAGAVRVDGAISPKGRVLRGGETVSVAALAEKQDWLPVPGGLPGAGIAYEDGQVIVLCKPHDAHTEPQRPNEAQTLAGHLLQLHPAVADISPVPGLTLLTRLDYATSGAVPAALTEESFRFLRHEREMGKIRKTYLCLVEGEIRSPSTIAYVIDAEGGETVRVRTERVDPDPRRWTVLEPVRSAGGRTLARATIARGKRHQIRAHLAAAGHPIVGDRKYSAVPPDGPGKGRLMLHAEEVEFRHPATGEPVTVRCPAPPEFPVS